MGSADRAALGLSDDPTLAGSDTRRGAVAGISLRRVAVDFDGLGIVHIAAESALDGLQIRLVPIRGQLNPVRQPAAQIVHELDCRRARAIPDLVGQDHLAVAVERGPGPHIADTLGRGLRFRDVLFLGVEASA